MSLDWTEPLEDPALRLRPIDVPSRGQREGAGLVVPEQRLEGAGGRLGKLLARFRTALFVILALGLVLVSKADIELFRALHALAADGAVGVLRVLRMPVMAMQDFGRAVGELLALRAENARLRAENRRLLAWRARAVQLEVENRSLRRMLAMPVLELAPRRTVARVVADSGSSFVRTVLLDAGRDRGIRPGMAVVNEQGLVGRVIAVGARSARVILLTDFDSRIPVVVGSSGDRALLEGDNTPWPKLRFLPLNPRFRLGDEVLTSGSGGLLPPGLAVGRVTAVRDHEVVVTPHVDWTRLDHVAVLDYRPPQPPDAEARDAGTAATIPHVRGGLAAAWMP